ncbi:MAG: SDR family NAD(P)-dependent oxidoreductase [Lachnospiraceae bacterium]
MNRKVAIVTGANGGLGRAILEKLAQEDYDIWACVRKHDAKVDEYVNGLCDLYKTEINIVEFDLAQPSQIKSAYSKVVEKNKRIDVLINNAGIGHMELFQLTKMEKVRYIYEVNLFAPMYLCQLVIPYMRRQKHGKILNIASTAAKEIYVGNAIYGATKSALIAFTQSLASEVAQYGITVNAIGPGLIDTKMSSVFEGKDPEEPLKHTALGRKILPEEIADIIIKLIDDKMSLINGEIIYVNGGHK